MESKSLTDLLSDDSEESEEPISYSELFWDKFPTYICFGMTEEQYWDKSPKLAVSYRKAEEIRYERMNHEKWLQGLYVYEAIGDVSPLLQAFAKKGTKAKDYPTKPYAMTEKQRKAKQADDERAAMERAKRYMMGCMANINIKLEGKGSEH